MGGGAELREGWGIACEALMQRFRPRWVTSVAHNQQICPCQVYTLHMSGGAVPWKPGPAHISTYPQEFPLRNKTGAKEKRKINETKKTQKSWRVLKVLWQLLLSWEQMRNLKNTE